MMISDELERQVEGMAVANFPLDSQALVKAC
jgi:hypothetical protein